MRSLVTAAAVLALALSAAAEDVVTFRDGSVARGVITSRDAEVVVMISAGAEVRIPVASITSEQHVVPPADPALLRDLATGTAAERAAAAEKIVTLWPDSAATLDAALAHAKTAVRLEATRLLDREEIDDVVSRVRSVLTDGEPSVRVAAVRVVRHRRLDGFESELISRFQYDCAPMVSTESLRALEDLGTVACLQPVFDEWERSRDDSRRRRCLRVLRRVTGADHGTDADAWRATVTKAVKDAATATATANRKD